MNVIQRFARTQVQWRTEQRGRQPVRVTVSPQTARDAAAHIAVSYGMPVSTPAGIGVVVGGCDWYEGDVPDGEFRFE